MRNEFYEGFCDENIFYFDFDCGYGNGNGISEMISGIQVSQGLANGKAGAFYSGNG